MAVSASDVATPPPPARAAPSTRLRLPRQPLLRHLLYALVGGAFFFGLTTVVGSFNDFQIGEIGAYAIALAGLSVLTGQNGQISLGHGALMAIGAYALALLVHHTSLNLVLELVIATLVAAAVGVVVGIPAARLSGAYLAGVTLLLALVVPLLAAQYGSVFGGEQGLTVTAPVAPGAIPTERWLAWIQLFSAIVIMVLLGNLVRSRYGRAFRAVRDDDVAASLLGVHVARTKVVAFSVSAGCAGLGGALLALSTGVVNTGEFPLALSIELLVGMVLGGAGTLFGAWWGGIALVYAPQWSTSLSGHLSLGTTAAAYLADAMFGVVLVVVIVAAPSGIQGALRRVAYRFTGRSPQTAAVLRQLVTNLGPPVSQQATQQTDPQQATQQTNEERSSP
ncbi:MAG: branched-chain amino acid ABC transporter permease [Acidimicrobiales bacterium]